ncbi:hypothetical protein NLI96_g11204 [Meripilus lineatus]|uniref:Uncharacterized protein n=1 Tax=Meripilus lineatus TaxID=2056292 RepID=A0AAD5USI5_9APHY|nr:hypothetical protein NLI96_g11204 [Physisporinus lineatus]
MILRAQEEITRCEIEARQLHTAILDEDWHFKQVLVHLRVSQDIILIAVQDFITWRLQINSRILADLQQMFSLQGFTGDPTPRQPVSSLFKESSVPSTPEPSDSDLGSDSDNPPDNDGDIDGHEPDEETNEALNRLQDFSV